MGLQIKEANYLTNVHLFYWGECFFFLSVCFPRMLFCHPVLGDRTRLDRRKFFFLVIYSWIFHLIFMPFAGLSGCSWEFAASEAGEAWKSGFSSSEPSGRRGKKRERGNERVRFHVFPSKWEAGLEGDRLCLLLICQPVNGERREEERAELLSTQVWEPGRAPSNKLPHTWSACPHSRGDRTPPC